MKKILALLLTLLLALSFAACDASLDTSSDSSGDSSTKSNEPVVVFDSENIKISYTGIVADYGVGEGLGFSVENSRSESIIVNMVDASYNDTMSAVIQPQVPLNVIIAGKKAEQPFVFQIRSLTVERFSLNSVCWMKITKNYSPLIFWRSPCDKVTNIKRKMKRSAVHKQVSVLLY